MGEIINMDGRKDGIGDKKRDPERKKKFKKKFLKSIPEIVTAFVTAIITAVVSTMINRIPLESELTERDKTIETLEAEKSAYEQTIETLEAEKAVHEKRIGTLEAETKAHEKTIEALEVEIDKNEAEKILIENKIKESELHFRASYLMCDIQDVVLTRSPEYNFLVVNNEISKVYDNYINQDIDNSNIEDYLNVKSEGINSNYKVVFLQIESFGPHLIQDLNVETTILKYNDFVEYDSYQTPRFEEYPEPDESEKYTFELKEQVVGQTILIPLLIKYENDDEKGNGPFSYHTYVYKDVYKPEYLKFTDGLTGEQKEIIIRDILKDYLQMDMHFICLG